MTPESEGTISLLTEDLSDSSSAESQYSMKNSFPSTETSALRCAERTYKKADFPEPLKSTLSSPRNCRFFLMSSRASAISPQSFMAAQTTTSQNDAIRLSLIERNGDLSPVIRGIQLQYGPR